MRLGDLWKKWERRESFALLTDVIRLLPAFVFVSVRGNNHAPSESCLQYVQGTVANKRGSR
jgi:hypothetical protein